jgi:hypothetical protein
MTATLVRGILTISVLTIFGCGDKASLTPPTTTPSSSASAPKDWSGLGVNTVSSSTKSADVKHSEYLVGAHVGYACGDCHSLTDPATGKYVAKDQICAACHPFSKYNGLMTNADHVALVAGTHCNKCHYSASGGATGVIGWRWSSQASPRTRIPDSQWHYNFKGVCLNCHTAANEAIPSAHPSGASTTACDTCHYYNNGKWAGQHVSATTGCRATGCHDNHYKPYNCEWCHTGTAAAGYLSWKLSFDKSGHRSSFDNRSCSACHSNGTGD